MDEVEVEQQEIEERAERLVEVEADLQASLDESSPRETEDSVDINLTSERILSSSVLTGRLTGATREQDQLLLHVMLPDEEVTFELPWPDDPTDRREPLVRLAHWQGVDPAHIADIDTVPVIERDGRYELHVPPGRQRRTLRFTLPGGMTVSPSYVTFSSRMRRIRYRFVRFWLLTTAAQPDRWGLDLNSRFFAALFFVPVTGFSLWTALLAADPMLFFGVFMLALLWFGPIYGMLVHDLSQGAGDRFRATEQ